MSTSDEKTGCARCGDALTGDGRTLWMACLYEMSELGIPFERRQIYSRHGSSSTVSHFYTLHVCKRCRGEWMAAIQQWFRTTPAQDKACGSGIFVRRNGATVEITREEWDRLHPGGDPDLAKE